MSQSGDAERFLKIRLGTWLLIILSHIDEEVGQSGQFAGNNPCPARKHFQIKFSKKI